MYSTLLNNERMLDFYNNYENYGIAQNERDWYKDSYKKLNNNLGKFIMLSDDSKSVSINKMDQILPNPKNIAIIINNYNVSTTEQFLLEAKQSKKVKLFGTTTAGILDISNMNFVKSPCNKYTLGYSVSRSLRIPDMVIDGNGIQPDYYIDNSVPEYKWIEFVRDILHQE